MKPCRLKSSWVYGLVLLFLPKCPMCWMAYLSLGGSLGLALIPYSQWIFYLLLAGFAVLVCFQTHYSFRTGEFRVPVLGAIALGLIVTMRLFNISPWIGLLLFSGMLCFRPAGYAKLARFIRKSLPERNPLYACSATQPKKGGFSNPPGKLDPSRSTFPLQGI